MTNMTSSGVQDGQVEALKLSSKWIVLKFGGTSVSTFTRWRIIEKTVRLRMQEGFRVWLVLSALSHITNALQNAVKIAASGEFPEAIFEDIVQKHLHLAKECGLYKENIVSASEFLHTALEKAALQPMQELLQVRKTKIK